MSLCRWSGTCDLYAYEDVDGGWVFEVSAAQLRETIIEATRDAALARLHRLRDEGVRFPDEVFERLVEA
ncbi:MAG: hypothetical protein KKG14_01955 [Alphaproteobacteria bacterium]|nr:hypothetical protein [Alphaproteobacteria bacterium]MBU2417449.1 hypothetical protein [Alphaproteobacteria bacterium]